MTQRMPTTTVDETGLSRLPLEVRQAIWKECLPDPATSPELYFYNRDDFGPNEPSASDDKPGGYAKFKVVIDYPVILQVCHESREYAWKNHGISFQQFPRRGRHIRGTSPSRHVLMPCRPYRSETDVFVYSEDNISDLWEISDRQRNDPTGVFRGIRHLALGSWHFMDRHAYRFWLSLLCTLPALRHVSIIFGHYWGFLDSTSWLNELCEFRHFTLAPFTEKTAWMHPKFEEFEDLEYPAVKVTDCLRALKDELSTYDVVDEDNAPWNKESGGWLFSLSAEKMVADPIESSRAWRRFKTSMKGGYLEYRSKSS